MGRAALAVDMIPHRVDVDLPGSDGGLPGGRGRRRAGLNFPAFQCYRLSGPPSVEHNHLAGIGQYDLLAGDAGALERCRRNAEGFKAGWKHIAEIPPRAGPQDVRQWPGGCRLHRQ